MRLVCMELRKKTLPMVELKNTEEVTTLSSENTAFKKQKKRPVCWGK